ncbi:MAG: Gfo/Idh/MocA family oxidoreductase [Anaerolineae bacterium]|nr:Gfo/Idh/MocA family oxidoreductase [Anaerolineae bacterium]
MTLRVAVIGAGQIARLGHLPGYQRAGAQIVALCSKRDQNFEALADEFHVEYRYDDWRQMLDAGGFEAVSICTPPALHSEMAAECARRGLHVLVEKPMAMTPAECDHVISAAAQTGVVLMVAHNQRFIAHHQHVKQLLQSGQLGKVYLAHAVFGHGGPEKWNPLQNWYFHPDQAGYGVLADLGSHKFDLLCWLLGQRIVEVSSFGQTFEKPTSASDSIICALRLSGGTLATVHVSWVFHPDWENSLVLRCERGVIRVPTDLTQPVEVLEQDAGSSTISAPDSALTDSAGWFGAVAAFCDAVQNGKPSPITGAEGKSVVAAVRAAYEALTEQRVVRLL